MAKPPFTTPTTTTRPLSAVPDLRGTDRDEPEPALPPQVAVFGTTIRRVPPIAAAIIEAHKGRSSEEVAHVVTAQLLEGLVGNLTREELIEAVIQTGQLLLVHGRVDDTLLPTSHPQNHALLPDAITCILTALGNLPTEMGPARITDTATIQATLDRLILCATLRDIFLDVAGRFDTQATHDEQALDEVARTTHRRMKSSIETNGAVADALAGLSALVRQPAQTAADSRRTNDALRSKTEADTRAQMQPQQPTAPGAPTATTTTTVTPSFPATPTATPAYPATTPTTPTTTPGGPRRG